MIPVSPTEALSKALWTFLLERLLSNQQITEAYARPNTTGGFQEGARERWEGRNDGRVGGRDGMVGEEEGGWDSEKAILELLKCLNFQVYVSLF